MGFTQLYETFSALEDPNFWQDAYMKFYNAWFEADRWKQYFQGLGTTIQVTVMALLIGVVLGVLVAMVRTAHDQQRPGRPRNFFLGVVNAICKVYVTVIRGTPMLVQVLIMGMVNEFIILLKDTSMISVIGGQELVYFAKNIVNRTFDAMFPLIGAAVIYLVLVMIFTWLQGKLERRLRQSDRR